MSRGENQNSNYERGDYFIENEDFIDMNEQKAQIYNSPRKENIVCFNCNQLGHYSTKCPNRNSLLSKNGSLSNFYRGSYQRERETKEKVMIEKNERKKLLFEIYEEDLPRFLELREQVEEERNEEEFKKKEEYIQEIVERTIQERMKSIEQKKNEKEVEKKKNEEESGEEAETKSKKSTPRVVKEKEKEKLQKK